MHALRATIVANLAAFPRRAIARDDLRRAAVAIPVAPVDEEPHYAITRRALTLRRGAGNWALPGGGFDPGEDAIDAALRETREELGIALGRDAALGLLDDLQTLSGHIVTPVVLFSAQSLRFDPNPDEVQHAWFVPLSQLEHPDAPLREANPDGGAAILRMPVRDSWINPPTAAFLYQFREAALHGRHARTDDIGQPSWTAR